MSSKMYLLSFTLSNCDCHDVDHVAVSSELKNLKTKAAVHAEEMNYDSGEINTVGKWQHRHHVDWYAPLLINRKNSQEMYYTIAEVEEV